MIREEMTGAAASSSSATPDYRCRAAADEQTQPPPFHTPSRCLPNPGPRATAAKLTCEEPI
jgi:hypothetical protein